MAEAPQKLGENEPAAATVATLYNCDAVGGAVISVVTVCNRSSTPDSYRLGVDVGGTGDTDSQWSYYDCPIGAFETHEVMKGATMANTDLLRCRSVNGDVAFNAFGVEIT